MDRRTLYSVLLIVAIFFTFSTFETVKVNKRVAQLNERVNGLQLDSKELKLTKMIVELQPSIDHNDLIEFRTAILDASDTWKISPILLAAMVYEESSFKKDRKGSKLPSGIRCIGPMQVHPIAHKEKLAKRNVTPSQLSVIAVNIDIGAEILKEYLERYHYDVALTLRKYVGGHSPQYTKNIISNYVYFDT